MNIIPGCSLPITFSLQRESEVKNWESQPTVPDISLPGEGFSLARNTTGLRIELYYQDNVIKDEQKLNDRVEFMRRYLNWPIALGNRYGGFLHDVFIAPTGPQEFGYIYVYLRTGAEMSQAAILNNLPTGPFFSLVALNSPKAISPFRASRLNGSPNVEMSLLGSTLFPTPPYPLVKYPQQPEEVNTIIYVDDVKVEDARRTSDNKVFLDSSSTISGTIPASGNTRLNVGANAMLQGRSYRLVSINRDKSDSSRITLEQDLS